MRVVLALLFGLIVSAGAIAQSCAVEENYAAGEVYICNGSVACNHGYTDVSGRSLSSQSLNLAVKNLILISAGQSLRGSEAPTAYVPTNASAVDNLNIYDGLVYAWADPPLGTTAAGTSVSGGGSGNINGRIADLFINAGKFDRVVVVPIAVGGSSVAQWDVGGPLYDRICLALQRLRAKNMVAQPNVTVAIEWGQGETDKSLGTSQAAYTASLQRVIDRAKACGFTGRFFVAKESWISGATGSAVQAAQAAVVDNVTVFASGDIDSLNSSNRLSDNTHLNDTGMAAAAALIKAAMSASGAPY